MKTGDMSLDRL